MMVWALKESDGIKGTHIYSCVAQKHFKLSPESFHFVSAAECKL